MPFEADSLHSSNPVQTEDPAGEQNRFQNLTENAFKRVADAPLSTFSVDVDTASYSKVREYLLRQRRLPPVDAVRIEELVNYFDYEYLPPKDSAETPFAAKAEIMACPWNEDHRLARIALKGKTMQPKNRPLSNLVFLLDTSGSMNSPNKLPLVKAGMNCCCRSLEKTIAWRSWFTLAQRGWFWIQPPPQKHERSRKLSIPWPLVEAPMEDKESNWPIKLPGTTSSMVESIV